MEASNCRAPTAPTVDDSTPSGSDHSDADSGETPGGSEDDASEPTIDEWTYNEALCLIQHEASECPTCDAFAQHYIEAAAREEQSLRDACEARDDAVGRAAQSSANNLRAERDQAIDEAVQLRRRVAEGERKIKEAQEALASAESSYAPVCGGDTHAPQPGPGPASLSRKRTRRGLTPPQEELTGDSVGLWIVEGPSHPVQKVSTQDIWRALAFTGRIVIF